MTLPQSPEQMPQAFADAWMARDATALAAMFVEDADFVNVVGLWWHNRADIEKAHDYGLKTFFQNSKIRVGRVEVRHLSENHAIVHTRWWLEGQLDQDGKSLDKRQTVMMFVAERHEDGWMAVATQNTDVVPGMETYQAKDGQLKPADYR